MATRLVDLKLSPWAFSTPNIFLSLEQLDWCMACWLPELPPLPLPPFPLPPEARLPLLFFLNFLNSLAIGPLLRSLVCGVDEWTLQLLCWGIELPCWSAAFALRTLPMLFVATSCMLSWTPSWLFMLLTLDFLAWWWLRKKRNVLNRKKCWNLSWFLWFWK